MSYVSKTASQVMIIDVSKRQNTVSELQFTRSQPWAKLTSKNPTDNKGFRELVNGVCFGPLLKVCV